MKKIFSTILLTVSVFAAGSSCVFAATTTDTAASTTSANDFQAHKAKVLKHIGERLTKIQQIQSCVEASTDQKSMRACKPKKDKEKHHAD